MALAVIRVAPVKASALAPMSAHHARSASAQDEHVDPTRSHLNRQLIGSGNPHRDVLALASQYKLGKTIDDPNLAAEIILTAGQDYFDHDFPNWRTNADALKPWLDAQLDFLKSNEKSVGKTVSVTLHLDEAAPHLHVVTVPVANIRVKNRHTDRIEPRISYAKIFGDDKPTLAEARRLHTTAIDTKLGRLQTLYAESMQEHGLNIERGISNTGRKHIAPQDYRDIISQPDIKAPETPNVPKPLIKSNVKDGLDLIKNGPKARIITEHREAAEKFRHSAQQNAYIIKQKETKIAALETELKMTKGENETLKTQLRTLSKSQQELAEELRQNKELLKEYRAITEYDLVRQKVATLKEIDDFQKQSGRTKFNAIDYVMHKEQCNIQTSVYVLAEHFSPELVASDAARRKADMLVPEAFAKADKDKSIVLETLAAIDCEPEKTLPVDTIKLSKSNKAKADIINKQLDALGDDTLYRITLMSTDKDRPTFNLGKGKGENGTEKFFTQQQIIDLIPTLSYRNAKGYNVFITPMPDEKTRFILLDDIKDMDAAKAYNPCLILQTSPNSKQAVYKVSGDMDEAATREFFNIVNKNNGDPAISGLIHPMRLAGFTNRKPKYEHGGQYPFVSIIHAQDTRSERAEGTIQSIKKAHEIDDMPMPEVTRKKKPQQQAGKPEPIRDTDIDAHGMRKWYQQQVGYWGDKCDFSKIDRRLAVHMSEQGFTARQTQQTILDVSPDIERRHGHELNKYLLGKTAGLEYAPEPERVHELKLER